MARKKYPVLCNLNLPQPTLFLQLVQYLLRLSVQLHISRDYFFTTPSLLSAGYRQISTIFPGYGIHGGSHPERKPQVLY